MNDYLTIEEIEAKYAPDWVLLTELKKDEVQQVLGGRVIDFGPDRDALYRKAKDLGLRHVAIRKLGPMFEDGVYWFTPQWMIESYFATAPAASDTSSLKENELG